MTPLDELIIKAVQDEEEYPDDMPAELWSYIFASKQNCETALRKTVRITKENILTRILTRLKEEGYIQ